MSDQPSLWDYTPAPTTRDRMSRAAAERIAGHAGALRFRVAAYVGEHGPVAEYAIELGLELRGNTVRPRLWELCKAGIVETRGRGVTPSGRACHLYALTWAGRLALEEPRP